MWKAFPWETYNDCGAKKNTKMNQNAWILAKRMWYKNFRLTNVKNGPRPIPTDAIFHTFSAIVFLAAQVFGHFEVSVFPKFRFFYPQKYHVDNVQRLQWKHVVDQRLPFRPLRATRNLLAAFSPICVKSGRLYVCRIHKFTSLWCQSGCETCSQDFTSYIFSFIFIFKHFELKLWTFLFFRKVQNHDNSSSSER